MFSTTELVIVTSLTLATSLTIATALTLAAISLRSPDLFSRIHHSVLTPRADHSSSPVDRRLSTTSMIPRGDLRIETKEDPKRLRDDWTLVAGGWFISSWQSDEEGVWLLRCLLEPSLDLQTGPYLQ